MIVHKIVRFCLLSLVPLLFAGCGPSSPQEAIVGTWQTGVGENKRKITYRENGLWQFDNGRGKITGAYKFLSNDKVEMKVDVPSDAKPIVYTRHITFSNRDTMNSIEGDSIRRTTWKRVE